LRLTTILTAFFLPGVLLAQTPSCLEFKGTITEKVNAGDVLDPLSIGQSITVRVVFPVPPPKSLELTDGYGYQFPRPSTAANLRVQVGEHIWATPLDQSPDPRLSVITKPAEFSASGAVLPVPVPKVTPGSMYPFVTVAIHLESREMKLRLQPFPPALPAAEEFDKRREIQLRQLIFFAKMDPKAGIRAQVDSVQPCKAGQP
jgi:hypothetical protein